MNSITARLVDNSEINAFDYTDGVVLQVGARHARLTVQIMVAEEGGASQIRRFVDDEDPAWRRAQWGQLIWVVHAIGLLIAGGIILLIGMTSVFVSEDLNFLCMKAEQAQALGGRMIGVVAHDRATLGGMLLASGVAMLLPVLWCFRRGKEWLWWAVAGLGASAYAAALGLHFAVGYTDWPHLAPAFAGLGLWASGLALNRNYMKSSPPRDQVRGGASAISRNDSAGYGSPRVSEGRKVIR